MNTMYAKLPNLILGFHGCRMDTYDNILHKHQKLKKSDNTYDWLGNGIYFWENSYQRAYEWAVSRYRDDGVVLGAVMDLGYCLNLTDYNSTDILKQGYEMLKMKCEASEIELPQNKYGRSKTDLLLRDLDCAVIQQIHEYNRETGNRCMIRLEVCLLKENESIRMPGLLRKHIYKSVSLIPTV